MKIEELESRWQSAIRKYFPTVVVRENLHAPNEPGEYILNVFRVPDNLRREFIRFLLNEVRHIAERENLPRVDLLPVGETDTRNLYSAIIREADAESVRQTVAAAPSVARSKAKTARPTASKNNVIRAKVKALS